MSFRVGQKVVCVETIYPLVKNEIYTISGIIKCSCGEELVSWGSKAPSAGFAKLTCHKCNAKLNHFNEWMCKSFRFRPIDYSFGEKVAEQITEQLEKTLKEKETLNPV